MLASDPVIVPPGFAERDVAAVEARMSLASPPAMAEPVSLVAAPVRRPPWRSVALAAAMILVGLVPAFGSSVVGHGAASDSQVPMRREGATSRRDPTGSTEACPVHSGDVELLVTPARPAVGHTLRLLAASYHDLTSAKLTVEDSRGRKTVEEQIVRGGPGGPTWALVGTLQPSRAGTLHVRVRDGHQRLLACADVEIGERGSARPIPLPAGFDGVWPVEHAWDARYELLFSAWVEQTFHVEPGARIGWHPLHQALRDPFRNVLHGYLGWNEDDPHERLESAELWADCADTLYMLRAYFAWKMRLPFLFHQCDRGNARTGPTCWAVHTNVDPEYGAEPHPVRRFNAFVSSKVRSMVHSGTTRTLATAHQSDFYLIPLTRQALRPGTVFVNPYGHVLMVSQWESQQPGRPGALYAVDGHPDESVTHKAFSRMFFPFMGQLDTGGFKMFRPAVFERGRVRQMTDAEIRSHAWLPPISVEQERMSSDAFYRRMDVLQNPRAVDPLQEARDAVAYLHRIARERARIVDDSQPAQSLPMPYFAFSGFLATHDWRRLATPILDLRMMVAIERLRDLPDLADAGRYPFAHQAEDFQVTAVIEHELASRVIAYRASDGTQRALSLRDLVDRRHRFAEAFDPNDCAEYRWGASASSDEYRTCDRRASRAELNRMRRLAGNLSVRWEPLGH